jgi:hypothetical protein
MAPKTGAGDADLLARLLALETALAKQQYSTTPEASAFYSKDF